MKKTLLTLVTIMLLTASSFAQVAINESGAQPDASAILDISSTDKGILIPRVTTTLRNAISTTQSGLLVYDTTTESFWYYDNTQADWVEIVVEGNLDIDGLSDGKTDNKSVFLGNLSGSNDNGSNSNSAIGVYSLKSNTSGSFNTAIGFGAANDNTSGSNNTTLGQYAGRLNTEGDYNTIVGSKANYTNQTGSNNTIIGYEAGRSVSAHNKTGNIFLGYQAGYNETGDNKLYIENSNSSIPLIGGDFSTKEIYFNGSIKITDGSQGSGKILTSGVDGTATWEQNSAAFDIDGLSDGKADASNLFLGNYSGVNDDGNNKTTGVGINSLYWNSSGTRNTALGYKSSYRNTTGVSNVAIGSEALYFNTTKSNLVAVGDSALYYNGNNSSSSSHSVYNTAVGSRSMLNNTTGHNNTAVGYKSMYSIEGGSHNVSLGHESLTRSVSGDYNIAMGSFSSSYNTHGNYNVNIGYGSDYNNTGGSSNTIIGYKAGFGSTGINRSGNIFIGREAGYNETGNNKLYIDNSNDATPLIGGDFDADEVYLHGEVGIGTSSLRERLHIAESNATTNGSDGSFALIQNTNGSTNVLSGIRFLNGITANTSKGGIFYRDMLGFGRGDIVFVNNSAGSSGDATFADARMTIKNDGKIGIGTTDPNEQLEVAHPTNDYGRMVVSDGGGSSRNALLFVSPKASNQAARIEAFNYGTSSGVTLNFNTSGHGDCVFGGNVGIGTSTPSELFEVVSTGDNKAASFTGEGSGSSDATIASINTGTDGVAGFFQSFGTDATVIFRQNGTGVISKAIGSSGGDVWDLNRDGSMEFYNSPENRTISIDPSDIGSADAGKITLYSADGLTPTIEINGGYGGDGRITTNELQITGGSDLSEFFDLSDYENIEKGMVVSIDTENPGYLVITKDAYDKKVAGIVSGANNIKPGLIMSQKGTIADGEHLIALSGRVYCWVDATAHPIEIGDMLTTSNVAGHAMKVVDNDKARGAIIGKAMTSLKSGKGLVLVLVSLQ